MWASVGSNRPIRDSRPPEGWIGITQGVQRAMGQSLSTPTLVDEITAPAIEKSPGALFPFDLYSCPGWWKQKSCYCSACVLGFLVARMQVDSKPAEKREPLLSLLLNDCFHDPPVGLAPGVVLLCQTIVKAKPWIQFKACDFPFENAGEPNKSSRKCCQVAVLQYLILLCELL